MILHQMARFVVVIALFLAGCAADLESQNKSEEDKGNTTDEQSELIDDELGLEGEKVTPVSEDAASNSIEIPAGAFDYQVVVRNGLALTEELDEAEEDSDKEKYGKDKEKKEKPYNEHDDDAGCEDDGDEEGECETEEEEHECEEEIETEDFEDKEGDEDEEHHKKKYDQCKKKKHEHDEIKEDELKVCSKAFGVKVEGVKIASKGNTVDLEATDIVAVKVTGTNNTANLLLTGDPESEDRPKFKGICFVLAGNNSAINVVLNQVVVEKAFMVAKGNESFARVEVKESATLLEASVNVKGNSKGIEIVGDGEFPQVDQD